VGPSKIHGLEKTKSTKRERVLLTFGAENQVLLWTYTGRKELKRNSKTSFLGLTLRNRGGKKGKAKKKHPQRSFRTPSWGGKKSS